MPFQVHALPVKSFLPLFELSDEQLVARNAFRMVADSKPGFPCRVSLADAEIGDRVILVNFEHLPVESPYRSSHAIFVRERAVQAFPEAGTVPEFLKSRLTSIRAFDQQHLMTDAEVVEGSSLPDEIRKMFKDPQVSYLHLHNAHRGCFSARVTRPD